MSNEMERNSVEKKDAFEDLLSELEEKLEMNSDSNSFSETKLKEMSKKLPEWSLEPPFKYLK